MAPAGNWSCLTAAAQAGAGSVYFGVGELNMRAHAAHNFKREDLPGLCSFAVNTICALTLPSTLFFTMRI